MVLAEKKNHRYCLVLREGTIWGEAYNMERNFITHRKEKKLYTVTKLGVTNYQKKKLE